MSWSAAPGSLTVRPMSGGTMPPHGAQSASRPQPRVSRTDRHRSARSVIYPEHGHLPGAAAIRAGPQRPGPLARRHIVPGANCLPRDARSATGTQHRWPRWYRPRSPALTAPGLTAPETRIRDDPAADALVLHSHANRGPWRLACLCTDRHVHSYCCGWPQYYEISGGPTLSASLMTRLSDMRCGRWQIRRGRAAQRHRTAGSGVSANGSCVQRSLLA
jgi:hypothetical protein